MPSDFFQVHCNTQTKIYFALFFVVALFYICFSFWFSVLVFLFFFSYCQVDALLQLVKHFGWTWVGVIAGDDDYGRGGANIFVNEVSQTITNKGIHNKIALFSFSLSILLK